jgi:hypothetical protein
MVATADGGGQFERVVLHPEVRVSAESNLAQALELHERAHALCFIARSVAFPVSFEPHVSGVRDVVLSDEPGGVRSNGDTGVNDKGRT